MSEKPTVAPCYRTVYIETALVCVISLIHDLKEFKMKVVLILFCMVVAVVALSPPGGLSVLAPASTRVQEMMNEVCPEYICFYIRHFNC